MSRALHTYACNLDSAYKIDPIPMPTTKINISLVLLCPSDNT